MLRYFLKRLLWSIPLFLVMTFLSFLILRLAPGDPATMFLDPRMSAADIAQLRVNLGLDQPIPIHYAKWLWQLLHGNLGFSFQTGKPVLLSITERLPATLLLSFLSIAFIVVSTFFLGLFSGARKDTFWDHFITLFSFIGMALPTFWVGLMLILFFSVKLDWFPTSGLMDPGAFDDGFFVGMANVLMHTALPLLTIVIGSLAKLTRFNRFGVISVLNQDYITAARARGVSEKRILYVHAGKNVLLPIVTILGLSLPDLIGGSFVIEYIFGWPGMGQLGIAAIFSRDYPILMGTIVMSSVLIILGNLLADMMYRWADPRIEEA
jgi:peptide/nickel transport system permease protein